jgi:broad specificity phosphatase PhoE
MRLILVRHAESKHTQQGFIAGIAGCTGLTEHGFEQAQLLANRLHMTRELNDCRTILCSPILRARQTAQVLAEVMPVKLVEQDDDLCELRPGDADGLSGQEYEEKYGAFDWLGSPTRLFAPNGESWLGFLDRVRATLERLANQYESQSVMAVTHAGFIVASILVLFDIPRPGTGAYLDPGHTSLTEWRKSNGTWRLVKYNDTNHLTTSARPANP